MVFKIGYSFIEIIIVLGILSLILLISVNVLLSFNKERTLESAAERIVSAINEAKSKTMSGEYASEYGVRFEQSRIVFFKGSVFTEPNSDNKEYKLPAEIEIYDIFLNNGGQDMFFKRFSGETEKYGSISLGFKNDHSKSKIIKIGISGITNY